MIDLIGHGSKNFFDKDPLLQKEEETGIPKEIVAPHFPNISELLKIRQLVVNKKLVEKPKTESSLLPLERRHELSLVAENTSHRLAPGNVYQFLQAPKNKKSDESSASRVRVFKEITQNRLIKRISSVVYSYSFLLVKGVVDSCFEILPKRWVNAVNNETNRIKEASSPKFLYHVLGDPIGAASTDLVGYEGQLAWNQLSSAMSCMSESVTDRNMQQTLQQQSALLQQGSAFEESIKKASTEAERNSIAIKLQQILESLGEQESFILPGGWVGLNGGHAMVYEFKKIQGTEFYQLMIHNVGAGARYHPEKDIEGKKEVSCLVIDKIPGKNLYNPLFIHMLGELDNPTQEWSEDYIYKALVPSLKGEMRTERSRYLDIQYSGTCAFASYFAYLQTKLSAKAYVQVRMWLGLRSLNDFTQSMNTSSEKNIALVEKCIHYFSQTIVQAHCDGLLNQEEIVCVRQGVAGIELRVQKHKQSLEKDLNRIPGSCGKENLVLKAAHTNFVPKLPRYQSPGSKTDEYITGALLEEVDLSDVRKLVPSLEKVIDWSKNQISLGNDEEVHFELGRLSYIIQKAFFEKAKEVGSVDEETRKNIIKQLYTLGSTYVKTLITVSKRKGNPVKTHSLMFKTLMELVSSARIVGGGNELIQKYPVNFNAVSRFFDEFYNSLERYTDEQRIAACIERTKKCFKYSDYKIYGFASVLDERGEIDLTKSYDDSVDFVEHFSKKYADEIKKKNAHIEYPIFLLNKSCEEISRTILPSDFFDYRDLIDLLLFVSAVHNQNADDSKQYFVATEITRKDNVFQFEKSPSVLKTRGVLFPENTIDKPDFIRELESTYAIATNMPRSSTAMPSIHKELRLIASAKNLRIDTAVATFAAHRELLHEKKWRNFLESTLFSQNVVVETCKERKKTPHVMDQFFEHQISLALAENDVELACYFLRLYRKLYERVKESSIAKPFALKERIQTAFTQVERKISSCENEEVIVRYRFLWHYERASFLHCHKQMTLQEVDMLLESILVSKRTVAGVDPELVYDTSVFIHDVFHRDDIQKRLTEDISLLINTSLYDAASSRKWSSVDSLCFVSEKPNPELSYHVLTGVVVENKKQMIVETPIWILSSDMVKRATLNSIPRYVLKESEGAYTFSVATQFFRVERAKEGMLIYKKIHDSWYQYVEESSISTIDWSSPYENVEHVIARIVKELPLTEEIIHNNTVWIFVCQGAPLFLIEKPDGSLVCEGKGGSAYTGAGEKLLPPEALPCSLLAFEDRQHIHVTAKNESTISKIVFPRIGQNGLSLTFDQKKKVYRVGEHGIMASDQSVFSLGRLRHKLVVMDEKTHKKKILIPGHKLSTIDHLKNAFEAMLLPDMHTNIVSSLDTASSLKEQPLLEHIPLYSYRKERGTIVSDSTEGNLYLAYTYLWQQQYEMGAQILDELERIPLSDESVRILSWIQEGSTHDQDAKGIALRMKARAALLRQKILFHKNIPDINEDVLVEKYQSCKHLCSPVFVTSEEALLLGGTPEEFAISISEKEAFIPNSVLSRKFRKDYWPSFVSDPNPGPLNPYFDRESFRGLFCLFQKPERLCTEWGKVQQIIKKSLAVQLAEYSPKEVKKLKTLLKIASRVPPSEHQTGAAILSCVLCEPKLFNDLKVDHLKEIDGKSFVKMFDIAEKTLILPLVVPRKSKKVFSLSASLPSRISSQKSLVVVSDPGKEVLLGKFPHLFTAISGQLLYPNKLKNREFSDVERHRFDLEKSGPLFDIGADFSESKMGCSTKEKTDSSICLGIRSDAVIYATEITSILKDTSPIVLQARKEFVDDVVSYKKQVLGGDTVKVSIEELKKAVIEIEKKAAETKSETRKCKKAIKEILSRTFEESGFSASHMTGVSASHIQSSSLQDAVYALLKPFPHGFLELNPSFTEDDALKLRDMVVQYLMHKTSQRHLQAVLQASKKLENPVLEEIESLYVLFQSMRNYSPVESPEYLVFEDAFGYFLRPQQIENLSLFLKGDVQAISKVIEMIMAAGKTSVLLPILSYITMTRKKLSVVIIPENLYPSMAPQIAQTLQKSFSTSVLSWELKGNESISVEALKVIEVGLRRALSGGEVVLLKPKDFTGLFLQFVNTIEKLPNPQAIEKIKSFQAIFTLFASDGEFLFDEVDSIWNVLKEHLLAASTLTPLDPTTLRVSTKLYKILLREKKSFLCKEELQEFLKEKFIEDLHVSQKSEALIAGYLNNTQPKEALLELSSLLQDSVAVARAQIQDILPSTYSRVFKIHYGEDSEKSGTFSYAIPYETGVPVRGSRFGHELEEINYTLQMYMQLPAQKMEPLLVNWIKQIMSEIHKEMEENIGITLDQTPSCKTFTSFFGEKLTQTLLFSSGENTVKDMMQFFEETSDKKIDFIERFILSKIERSEIYTRVTSQIYNSLCSLLRGFSGTLWNKMTYPVLLADASPESVGKTMAILSSEQEEVFVFSEIEALYSAGKGVIDIGGVLKDKEGEEVARAILEASDSHDVDGVIFYDAQKLPYVLDRLKKIVPLAKCSIPAEKLTAFWAQPFITGSDLRVATHTTCTACISKDTILRDLLQGVWRLRKLGKGQHINFAVSEETRKIICSELGLGDCDLKSKHIIAYVLKKQIDQQSSDNYRALQHKAQSLLERGVVALMLQSGIDELKEIFENCKDLFVQTSSPSPFDRYGERCTKIPTKEAIENIKATTLDSRVCRYLCEKKVISRSEVEKELEKISLLIQPALPEEVSCVPHNSNTMVQVQVQTQTQTQMQTTVVEEFHTEKIGNLVNFTVLLSNFFNSSDTYILQDSKEITPKLINKQRKMCCFYLNDIFGFKKKTEKFFAIFPQTVGTSINLHQIVKTDFDPLTKIFQPLEYALFVQKGNERACIAINQADVERLRSFFGYGSGEIAVINIHSGVIYPLNENFNEESCENDFSLLVDRVCLKIFSGDLKLTNTELLAFFTRCIALGPNGCEKMRAFIEEYVCLLHPHAAEAKDVLLQYLSPEGKKHIRQKLDQLRSQPEGIKYKKELEEVYQRSTPT